MIRELLKFTEQPDVISFAGGLPAPDVFPVEEFKRACTFVLDNYGAQALQYGSTDGYLPLREMTVRFTNRLGIGIDASNVLITSGSQQALDLLGKIFINRGDHIVVESPTYLGALQAWNAYDAEYIPVQCDEYGMVIDDLEEALRKGPKFIYVLPNFQNPSGVTLSLERRIKLVELADKYGVPIVEDDPYGRLRYEGEDIPPVELIDARLHEDHGHYTGNVIYLSTFSKILAPGIRLAWVIAPTEVIAKLNLAKQGADLHTSTFNQILAHEVSQHGFLDKHIPIIQECYRTRRNAMLESLEENMPEGVTWTHPQGGLFLWLKVPEKLDTMDLFTSAIAEKVAFVPGVSFFANGDVHNAMRLNFSCCKPEVINEGVSRLSKIIKKELVTK
jgi:2-aminoadipate transaminase